MNFWDRTAPAASEQPQGLGAEYRAWRRQTSASAIYAEPTAPAAGPDLYVARQYGGLDSYAGAKADPLAPRPDESREAYQRRILSVARALPDEEVQARLAAVDERIASHNELRQHLDGRTTGTGIGIMGLSPADRAAAVGRFGGRQVEANGTATVEPLSDGRPASAAEINMIMREREAARQGQQPQRTEIPTGSSGTGIFLGK